MTQEQKWIKAVLRRGSKDAADQLVRSYYDAVYTFVYHQMSSPENAMDLTQVIFIAALRSLPTYDAKKAGFRTWLYRIATNKVIDARRKVRPITVAIDEEEIAEGDFSDGVLNRELLGRIEEYVSLFDPHIQSIFRLRIYADYSFPEIAETLSQPEAKIKAQYYRLMKRVREEFDNHA
ncbi:MAG: sigma-70 family RNA polymerase sigma factor [Clostridiales bacterium]|nr:sigma-70 family RNA polymerase sigma factor [Clostridiales bacterium]